MNFKKWLEETHKIEEIGKETKSDIASMLVVERCKSLRDMMDESLEAILTEEEFTQFRIVEGKHMMLTLLKTIHEANNMFKSDSELDDSDKED